MADWTSDWSDLFFSLVPPGTLLQAVNSFLSLNPDVHMLPFTSLTHLTVLYAVSHSLLNHSVATDQLTVWGIENRGGNSMQKSGGALPLHYTTIPFQFALRIWSLLSSCIILICNVRAPNLKYSEGGMPPDPPLAAVCLPHNIIHPPQSEVSSYATVQFTSGV